MNRSKDSNAHIVKEPNMVYFHVHSPCRAWKKGDYPYFAFVEIGACGTRLSSRLMTEAEIDGQAAYLHEEIDRACAAAKRELRKQNDRIEKGSAEARAERVAQDRAAKE